MRIDGIRRVAAVTWALLAVSTTVHAQFEARGVPVGKDGVISRANLDANEVWPLTIERGTFVCDGEAVFIAAGDVQYPLNGVAKTLAGTHPEKRKPLEDIWRRDEKSTEGLKAAGAPIAVVRLNITPVLSRGVQWCRERWEPKRPG
jgi:hypothetical protein